MGCCTTFQKQILFIFNLLFALSGIGIIVVGSLILNGINTDELSEVIGYIRAPPIVLIVTGSIIFVVAFLGCCGAQKKNRCMLILYAVALLCILIIELTIGIYALVHWKDQEGYLKAELGNKFVRYNEDVKVKKMFDGLQTTFKCCGVNSFNDYRSWLNPPAAIPQSCCGKSIPSCSSAVCYRIGCASAVSKWLKTHSKILGGVAIAFAFIEVIGIIFACNVANSKKKQKQPKIRSETSN